MKNTKRILSVKIKRMIDEDPDTSYFGEYSNHATSEFSIDRMHSEDCASVIPVNQTGVRKLRTARAYVIDLQNTIACDSQDWEDLEDAYSLLDSLVEDNPECDCGGHNVSSREYRYFNPSFNYVDKSGKPVDGNTPKDIRKYVRQDYERMERLNAGDWCYIGIQSEAIIYIPYMTEGRGGRTYFKSEPITSGGLWGIESDSEKSYIESVQQEELDNLKLELLALGLSRRAIATAFKNVEEVSE